MVFNIKHDKNDNKFFVELSNKEAYLRYVMRSSKMMDIISTYVPVDHRNKGIAAKLVEASLKYAEENDLGIIPTCPYVGVYLERNPEYKKLLEK
jgi:uncharacterized protein